MSCFCPNDSRIFRIPIQVQSIWQLTNRHFGPMFFFVPMSPFARVSFSLSVATLWCESVLRWWCATTPRAAGFPWAGAASPTSRWGSARSITRTTSPVATSTSFTGSAFRTNRWVPSQNRSLLCNALILSNPVICHFQCCQSDWARRGKLGLHYLYPE